MARRRMLGRAGRHRSRCRRRNGLRTSEFAPRRSTKASHRGGSGRGSRRWHRHRGRSRCWRWRGTPSCRGLSRGRIRRSQSLTRRGCRNRSRLSSSKSRGSRFGRRGSRRRTPRGRSRCRTRFRGAKGKSGDWRRRGSRCGSDRRSPSCRSRGRDLVFRESRHRSSRGLRATPRNRASRSRRGRWCHFRLSLSRRAPSSRSWCRRRRKGPRHGGRFRRSDRRRRSRDRQHRRLGCGAPRSRRRGSRHHESRPGIGRHLEIRRRSPSGRSGSLSRCRRLRVSPGRRRHGRCHRQRSANAIHRDRTRSKSRLLRGRKRLSRRGHRSPPGRISSGGHWLRLLGRSGRLAPAGRSRCRSGGWNSISPDGHRRRHRLGTCLMTGPRRCLRESRGGSRLGSGRCRFPHRCGSCRGSRYWRRRDGWRRPPPFRRDLSPPGRRGLRRSRRHSGSRHAGGKPIHRSSRLHQGR